MFWSPFHLLVNSKCLHTDFTPSEKYALVFSTVSIDYLIFSQILSCVQFIFFDRKGRKKVWIFQRRVVHFVLGVLQQQVRKIWLLFLDRIKEASLEIKGIWRKFSSTNIQWAPFQRCSDSQFWIWSPSVFITQAVHYWSRH